MSTPQQSPVREGATLALVLSPLAGDDAYVPYFGSAFPLRPDGQVVLGSEAVERLSSETVPVDSETISLDTLREHVRGVEQARAEATQAAAAMAEGVDRQPPPVHEMPLGFQGGGRPSTPEPGETTDHFRDGTP